jgi:ribosomal protein L32
MAKTSRRYAFERGPDGNVSAMIWLGDFVFERSAITYRECPRCGSERMAQNRCLTCWHEAPRHTVTERRL